MGEPGCQGSWLILLVGYRYFNDKMVQVQKLYLLEWPNLPIRIGRKNRTKRPPFARTAKGRLDKREGSVRRAGMLLFGGPKLNVSEVH